MKTFNETNKLNGKLDAFDTLPRRMNGEVRSVEFGVRNGASGHGNDKDEDGGWRMEDGAKIQNPNTNLQRNSNAQASNGAATLDSREELTIPTAGVEKAPKKKGLRNFIVAAVLIVAAVGVGIYYWRFVAPYESTDDAFIDAHVTAVAPQVAGRVVALNARDNQEVKKGDVLLEIDPRDFQMKVDEAAANLGSAKGRLAQAKAQYAVDQAKVEQEQANVEFTEADAARTATDLKRVQAIGDRGISQSEIDLAGTQAKSAAAQVEVVKNKVLAAKAQAALSEASIETAQAEVEQAEATLSNAGLNLSYTKVVAPDDGYITHRTVESGAYVQTGQALLALVPKHVWVVANFKETQLKNMRQGQAVSLRVDAYPQAQFTGHVDSIQAGSGAAFSLLPPENASGNYVKVVQRVPVKIELDNVDGKYLLGPGMSVVPEVRVK